MDFIKTYLIFYLSMFVIFSCSRNETLHSHNGDLDMIPGKNYILFINYTIDQIKDQTTVSYHSHLIKEGKLKQKHTQNTADNLLIIRQLDRNKTVLDSLLIKNPLNEEIEYVNDSGQLTRKIMQKDKAELSARVQLHQDVKYIELSLKDAKPGNTSLHQLNL